MTHPLVGRVLFSQQQCGQGIAPKILAARHQECVLLVVDNMFYQLMAPHLCSAQSLNFEIQSVVSLNGIGCSGGAFSDFCLTDSSAVC
jgi:hypothetical protein